MVRFPNDVMVRRRIRRRKPMLDVSLQLIACKIVSGSSDKGPQSWMTNVSSCSSRILPGEGQLQTHVRKQQKYPFRGQGYIPNVCRVLSVDDLPSKRTDINRHVSDQLTMDCVPSMTVFILFTRPCTTLNVCATVIRASSWVNRSSR